MNLLASLFLVKLTLGVVLFTLLLVWSLVWKGIALWIAARKSDKWWYIVILIVNTLGILEILYIYIFSKRKKEI